MKVLFDVVHPAHVHFVRHVREDLVADGHDTLVVSRHKDVTLELLDRLAIPHVCAGPAATGAWLSRASELAGRVRTLLGHIRRFRPDVVLTRNPAGVQAARLAGVPGVFDTDDGTAVGLHFHAARPFAHLITTPACIRQDFGRKHLRYPGFKSMAYLHPSRFRPDTNIRRQLGLEPDAALFVLRFSAHAAFHDTKIRGLSPPTRHELVRRLTAHGHVVVSSEGPLPRGLQPHVPPLGPDQFHHLLAAADLCVGDSQSVAAEAAVLGTPAYRLSTFSDRVDYLQELEQRYRLVRNYVPGEETRFLTDVAQAAQDLTGVNQRAGEGHRRLLADSVDLSSWLYALLLEVGDGRRQRRRRAARARRGPRHDQSRADGEDPRRAPCTQQEGR